MSSSSSSSAAAHMLAQRARAAQETVNIVSGGSYVDPKGGQRVDIAQWRDSVLMRSVRLRAEDDAAGSLAVDGNTWWVPAPGDVEGPTGGAAAVHVVDESPLAAARKLVRESADFGQMPLIVNPASGTSAGGAAFAGRDGQEEQLVRCTSLYESLSRGPGSASVYRFHRTNLGRCNGLYSNSVVVSPGVLVIREPPGSGSQPQAEGQGAGESLLPLGECFAVSVLSCTPPYSRTAVEARVPEASVTAVLEERCRRVLEVAAALGASFLVLGAYGCGPPFRNDPKAAGRAFRALLLDEGAPFAGSFRRVVFALPELRHAHSPATTLPFHRHMQRIVARDFADALGASQRPVVVLRRAAGPVSPPSAAERLPRPAATCVAPPAVSPPQQQPQPKSVPGAPGWKSDGKSRTADDRPAAGARTGSSKRSRRRQRELARRINGSAPGEEAHT